MTELAEGSNVIRAPELEYVHAIYNEKVNNFYRVFAGYFRRKRQQRFIAKFEGCASVIDLGGTVDTWENVTFAKQITLLNVGEPPEHLPAKFKYIKGDGRDTGIVNTFDLAFSNSAIEHVGTFDDQRRFAGEMLRLGRRIYCQTPNKWFPIEPHFLGLFVHWLPLKWFTPVMYRYFTLNGWVAKPDRRNCSELIASVRLLTRKELMRLFPGCELKVERFLGLPKSFIVIK